jgi:MFS family permease
MGIAASPQTVLGGPGRFPPGLHNAFLFATFNALSFQVVLGSPMVLYGKNLGASATVLGIMTGMMPLLSTFQIPAAQYIDRVGYKRFVYGGWGVRILFIFAMALVPLTSGFLTAPTCLVLLLSLLFGFNLSRGISSAAWLPWITTLVPAAMRGRYLATDAAVTNLASLISFLLSAACLGNNPGSWQFSTVFTISAVMGALSLIFLKRIPDVEPPKSIQPSGHPVPWLEMLRWTPFRKQLRMVVIWSLAYGGMTTFTVAYLKVLGGLPDGTILLLTSISFLGGLCSLWFLGARLDHLGSRPVLCFSFAIWCVLALGWGCIAGKIFAPRLGLVLGLQFFMGLFAALVTMANLRLAMAVIPEMGRNHFFALFTVVGSLALGLAPIGWGLLIDAIGASQADWLGLNWNRYTVFFCAAAVCFLAAVGLGNQLHEPQAARMDRLLREILIASPQRLWVRFWPRS